MLSLVSCIPPVLAHLNQIEGPPGLRLNRFSKLSEFHTSLAYHLDLIEYYAAFCNTSTLAFR